MDETFIVDAKSRKIKVPLGFVLGVESDERVKNVHIEMPRFVEDGVDLMTYGIRIIYRNANGEDGQYFISDITLEDETIKFDWLVPRSATRYNGTTYFIVCAAVTDTNGNITSEWNTTLCAVQVLGGLEYPDEEDVPGDEAIIIEQFLASLEQSSTAALTAASNAQVSAQSASASAQSASDDADTVASIASAMSTLADELVAYDRSVRNAGNEAAYTLSGNSLMFNPEV